MEILKIRNPKANFSYVKIKPRQEFSINFASMLGNCPPEQIIDFTWNSDYLELHEEKNSDRFDPPTKMHFCQTFPEIMEDWAKYSSVVLGEICIVRPKGQSKLVVVLEQSLPKVNDILTIIDPDNLTLSLRPKQILEIILTGDDAQCLYCATGLTINQCFYHQAAWATTEVNDERMTCSGTQISEGIYTVDIGNDAPIRVVPKVTGVAKHFWYKNYLAGFNWPAGSYNAGRIYCEGGEFEGQINLNLKLRRKDTSKKGLSIPSPIQNTVVPYCKNVILEKVGGEFEECESVEYIGGNKIIKTVDNRVIVYKPKCSHLA